MKQILAMIVILLLSSVALAQSVELDMSRLTPQQAAQVRQIQVDIEKAASGQTALPTPSQMEKFATYGESIAKAIGAACKELRVEVNEFIRTPVGKMVAFLIVWKIAGRDILRAAVATFVWIVILSISLWSYKRMFGTERVQKEDGYVKYIPKYEFESREGKSWAVVLHVGVPILFTVLWVIVI